MDSEFLTTILHDCDPAWRKADIVEALLRHLVENGTITPQDLPSVHAAVLARETLGSTGIGRGIAIPHTRHASVSKRVALFGLCSRPVEFDSIDGEPVDVFVLMLVPPARPGSTMKIDPMAERLMRCFRDDEFLRRVRACATPAEIRTVLTSHSIP